MPIKRLTPDSVIDDYFSNLVKRIERDIIRKLCYVGEKCVNHVKLLPEPKFPIMKPDKVPYPHKPNFISWTGNLKESVGYVVVVDGNIVEITGFSGEGGVDGKHFAQQLISKFPTGICLIVVAGMNYATYVSARGYDVLDSSELLAKKLVPQMLEKLGFKWL